MEINTMRSETKAEIRNRILSVRDMMSPNEKAEYDRQIAKRVISVVDERHIRTVLTYVSFRSEVDTHGIIKMLLEKGVRIAAPRVVKPDIMFFDISSMKDLTDGYMGIMEPDNSCEIWERTEYDTLILVPGSVFDRSGNRIGYGGGYYDRFLSAYPDIYSVGLTYECQVINEVPADTWDRRLDMVITQEGMYVTGTGR